MLQFQLEYRCPTYWVPWSECTWRSWPISFLMLSEPIIDKSGHTVGKPWTVTIHPLTSSWQEHRHLQLFSTDSPRWPLWSWKRPQSCSGAKNPTTQSPATRANYLRSAELAKATDTMQDRNSQTRTRLFSNHNQQGTLRSCFSCWNSSALPGLEKRRAHANMH